MSDVQKKFTIDDGGTKRDSRDLIGLEIEQTAEGFQLVQPYRVLAKSSLVNMDPEPGKPILSFHVPDYLGWKWDIEVMDIDSTTQPETMSGNWHNNDKTQPAGGAPDEDGVWVATGSGKGEEGDEEARSASAY